MKKCFCILLALLMLFASAAAENRVFLDRETQPFPEDAELLTLRVAGTYGGDCMLLSWGGQTMLIDTGTDVFMPHIEKMLQEAGSPKHVDILFNTHPHRDHIGSLFPMIEEGYEIGQLVTVFPHDYDDGEPSVQQIEAIAAAEKAGIPVTDMKNGDTFSFGPAQVTVIRLPEENTPRSVSTNTLSAMLLIRYGDCSVLLTGDCEADGQSILAPLVDMKADILKFPHHGYNEVSRKFLLNVDPEFVFITNGSSETRAAAAQLERERRYRYLFSSWGEITFRTDGTKWIVSQEVYPEYTKHVERHIQHMQSR